MAVFLMLSILFNTGFAACYKVAARRNANLHAVNVWMYVGSTATVLIYILLKQRFVINIKALELGVAAGFMVYFATLSFFYHIKYGQLSASWTVISLAIAFPVVASIVVWHERPSGRQVVGLILILFALLLFGRHESSTAEEQT